MWLLNVRTYRLKEFVDCTQVRYAILSHRWEEEEVSFLDMVHADGNTAHVKSMKGFYKIRKSCEEAARRGKQYVWIDTCCIDRSSSAELQEAINSMFRWYSSADVAFAFLSDVRQDHDSYALETSLWFTRGWTLQELLAPATLLFFDVHWQLIGDRKILARQISAITRIPTEIVQSRFDSTKRSKSKPCIAAVMSWACERMTTRPEDRAYSLLGLFDINMPVLYGEGEKAFYRLQCEILSQNEDQSIFAWDVYVPPATGLLAASPDNFQATPASLRLNGPYSLRRRKPPKVTSEGISMEVELYPLSFHTYIALLNLDFDEYEEEDWPDEGVTAWTGPSVGIYVRRVDDSSRYVRVSEPLLEHHTSIGSDLAWWRHVIGLSQMRKITVVRELRDYEEEIKRQKHITVFLKTTTKQKDHWSYWLKREALETKIIEIQGPRVVNKRLIVAYPAPEVILEGLSALTLISTDLSQTFPFEVFAIGHDFDFNPILLISMKNFDRTALEWSFREILGILPTDTFENEEDPFPSTGIRIRYYQGGRYRTTSNAFLAFQMHGKGRKDSRKLKIRLKLATGFAVRIAVAVSRAKKDVWSLYIDLEDSLEFWDDVKHDLFVEASGLVDSD